MSDFESGSLISIIGCIVAFLLSFWGQRMAKKSDEKKQIESFLIAIKSEISSVWNNYYENIGVAVEKLEDNEGLNFYYPIFDNYFIVYDNNTNLIGGLDGNLSEILIKTYTSAKGLKDSFIFNNQLLNEKRRYEDLANETSSLPDSKKHYLTQYQTSYQEWQKYGQSIQVSHVSLKESKDNLIVSVR